MLINEKKLRNFIKSQLLLEDVNVTARKSLNYLKNSFSFTEYAMEPVINNLELGSGLSEELRLILLAGLDGKNNLKSLFNKVKTTLLAIDNQSEKPIQILIKIKNAIDNLPESTNEEKIIKMIFGVLAENFMTSVSQKYGFDRDEMRSAKRRQYQILNKNFKGQLTAIHHIGYARGSAKFDTVNKFIEERIKNPYDELSAWLNLANPSKDIKDLSFDTQNISFHCELSGPIISVHQRESQTDRYDSAITGLGGYRSTEMGVIQGGSGFVKHPEQLSDIMDLDNIKNAIQDLKAGHVSRFECVTNGKVKSFIMGPEDVKRIQKMSLEDPEGYNTFLKLIEENEIVLKDLRLTEKSLSQLGLPQDAVVYKQQNKDAKNKFNKIKDNVEASVIISKEAGWKPSDNDWKKTAKKLPIQTNNVLASFYFSNSDIKIGDGFLFKDINLYLKLKNEELISTYEIYKKKIDVDLSDLIQKDKERDIWLRVDFDFGDKDNRGSSGWANIRDISKFNDINYRIHYFMKNVINDVREKLPSSAIIKEKIKLYYYTTSKEMKPIQLPSTEIIEKIKKDPKGNHHVWKDGFNKWMRWNEVEEFKNSLNEAKVRNLIRNALLEYVVPMGYSLKSWKKKKKKEKISNKDYAEKTKGDKWKVVHGKTKGKIGKPISKSAKNLSYSKATKMHSAIKLNEKIRDLLFDD